MSKPERLTAEELAALRTAIDRGSAILLGVSMRSLLDTIDALTAERDEARAEGARVRAVLGWYAPEAMQPDHPDFTAVAEHVLRAVREAVE